MNIDPILLLNYDKWLAYRNQITLDNIKKALSETFNNIPILLKINNIEVSIVLESDEGIKKLNKSFRFINKPTNVLSFPLYEIKPNCPIENTIFEPNISLGDIVFGFETIENEAKNQNKPFLNHFLHLLIHGTLHLVGYDHETDEDAEIMENLEIKILNKFNIPSPYLY